MRAFLFPLVSSHANFVRIHSTQFFKFGTINIEQTGETHGNGCSFHDGDVTRKPRSKTPPFLGLNFNPKPKPS
jgi:hypothetical protein